ncbi:MAG TPA: DUF87 domain-containing protein [Candidatus Peregrinibacteria bacterium]|nr:DUF87 domain-containing protein [Candidatus Peregrinibacteria bacterium]
MLNFFTSSIFDYFSAHPFWGSVYLILFLSFVYLTFNFLLGLARFSFALRKGKGLVFMKVTMPRTESKKDREEKQEKDFREIIGVMQQLFRSLYEIKELNLWNTIRTMIWNSDKMSFEILCENKQVHFYIVTYDWYQDIIEKQITTYYPDADIRVVEPYEIAPKGSCTKCYHLYEKRIYYYPIRTYKTIESDPLNDLTNVFSKLQENEKAVIQMVIDPKSRKGWSKKAKGFATKKFKGKRVTFFDRIPILSSLPLLNLPLKILGGIFGMLIKGESPVTSAPGAGGGDHFVRMLQTEEEVLKQIGEKSNQPGFDTTIRVIASSDTKEKAQSILSNTVLAFNLFMHRGMNWFQNRRIVPLDIVSNPWMLFNFRYRMHNYGEKKSIMVPEELASIFHLPNSRYNTSPVINWLDYKVLPPPADLPKEGVLLGYNVYRGIKKEIRMLKKDRTRHHYIIGKSGSGKSAFLSYIARQDIRNKEGLCVVDPHGDLIEDILTYVPKERAKEIVVFNPADQERPMGLNMLEAETPEQMDMASLQATEIFIKLFGDEIFGPRIQHYFRNACLTLMEDKDEGATIIDVPRMFVDDEFMKYKVSKVRNPVVRSFWEHEYANTGERERQEMIPYFSSKFGPFITNTVMRNTIGQPKSAFNFREIMDNGKVLLINLSKGKIGDLNTQLLGLVVVARIQMAAMSRVDIPEKDRRDFYLYVDEFQNFATDSFCSILSEARKYKLAIIMAHQYINQLVTNKFGSTSTQIRDAVFGNVGTMMSFKIGAEDAEYMAKEYAPLLSEQDVIGISNYKAYMKLNIDNSTSRPFSMETIWDTTNSNQKVADIVKQYSRIKYGRKRAFVDQEVEARIGIEV